MALIVTVQSAQPTSCTPLCSAFAMDAMAEVVSALAAAEVKALSGSPLSESEPT